MVINYTLRCITLWMLFISFVTSVHAASISGDLSKWQPIAIDFTGPSAAENLDSPNPFLDYRLTVKLISPSGHQITVPGFFAGDGNGGGSGNVWRARFSADEIGQWRYSAMLHQGHEIAVDLNESAGNPMTLQDASGSFHIDPARSHAQGFFRHGRLEYVGGHYLKFRDGPYWIKGGTDSPENLLGFAGFDNTYSQGGAEPGFLHQFSAHRSEWREGDPLFRSADSGVDARGLIGALNYLGSQGVNSIYFLPMNLGGDGQDTYPFIGTENNHYDKTHYDISKLHQWNLILNHAQSQGIALNIVLSETEPENEQWFDGGQMGVERKLYFRELIARFGYLLAAKWNLGEENDFPVDQLRQQADYIQALDWSNKPIAVHNHLHSFYHYDRITGDSRFRATSIQYDAPKAGYLVERWRQQSSASGNPWVIDMDENSNGASSENAERRRKEILYDVLFSGGNIEWYFGSNPEPLGGDITADDFHQYEAMWRFTRHARVFMENELPFWNMQPADGLVSGESGTFGGAEVFALPGELYAVYLPETNGNELLDLTGVGGDFIQRWFDPASGEFAGNTVSVTGGQSILLGNPPGRWAQDWVVLVRRAGFLGANSAANSQSAQPQTVSVEQPIVNNESDAQAQNIAQPDPVEQSINAPVFIPIDSQQIKVGETLILPVQPYDLDGFPPALNLLNVLDSARMEDNGDGTRTLYWTPSPAEIGLITLTFVATDATDPALQVKLDVSVQIIP